MNHYKVGYKAVIEVDKVFEQDGEKLYRAKGMKSLVFDGKGLDKLKPLSAYTETLKKEAEENYRMGVNAEYENWKEHLSRIRAVWQNEAWELARKCMLMTDRDRENIFGSGHNALYGVLTYFDYKHAAAKVEAWEKATIRLGDEVERNDGGDDKFIVSLIRNGRISGITQNGNVFNDHLVEYWHKTGRHIDIEGLLNQIGEE